jgi:serine/threonine-protein kinase HipA
MTRSARIYVNDDLAGILTESSDGEYSFQYISEYLANENSQAVSLTLPKRKEAYIANTLFPFFDGLIPEGWLMDIGVKNWKLNAKDRMGLLLFLCADCIGNVSVINEK